MSKSMSKCKLVLILVIIWVAIFLALVMLDMFVLRYPANSNGLATLRLIPSTRRAAAALGDSVQLEQVIQQLGYPNGTYPTSGVGRAYWDLQLGSQLIVTNYGSANLSAEVTEPFTASFRWLVFPGIMLCVALSELLAVFLIHKHRELN